MVLFFSHHLFAGLRACQVSLDLSLEPAVVCVEWISVEHLLRHHAVTAIHGIDVGLWSCFLDRWIHWFSPLPEFICVLRVRFRCHQRVQFGSRMWFNASGSSRSVTIRYGKLSQGSRGVALPITN